MSKKNSTFVLYLVELCLYPTMFKPLTAEITYCAFRGGFKSEIKFYFLFRYCHAGACLDVFASRDTKYYKIHKTSLFVLKHHQHILIMLADLS